jgi:hypothetical protein
MTPLPVKNPVADFADAWRIIQSLEMTASFILPLYLFTQESIKQAGT